MYGDLMTKEVRATLVPCRKVQEKFGLEVIQQGQKKNTDIEIIL